MELSAFEDNEKRGIDNPKLNQDVTFNQKDDENFDDTDDFHKFDDTDSEDKSTTEFDSPPVNKRLRDKSTDTVKRVGLNDGNIFI